MVHYSLTLLHQKRQNLLSLPAEYKVHGSRFAGIGLIVFSVLFGAEFLLHAALALVRHDMNIVREQDWIFGTISILFFFWGINQFFIKGKLVIADGKVTCAYESLFGGDKWTEPLSDYKGVKKKTDSDLSGNADQIIYTIWLVHRQRKKSLKIYTSWSDERWNEELDWYSGMLKIPKSS